MAKPILAMVPEIGDLFQGVDYDIVIAERAKKDSELSKSPVDDPNKSFINDLFRDKPTILTLQLTVSTININEQPQAVEDVTKPSALYEKLIDLKRQQTVDPEALLTIQTGVFEHRNMAIRSIQPTRTKTLSQSISVLLLLEEMRFARTPVKILATTTEISAASGPVNQNNERVSDEQDRLTVEGTQENSTGAGTNVTNSDQSLLFGAFGL